MNNSQSIQDQLNQEFDRIFWSFKGSTSNTSAIGRIVIDTLYFMKCSLLDYSFETCGENTKREILAAIFLAKDDQGEYILKEGDNTTRIEYIGDHNVAVSTETFRTIFKQNCFAETQEEIDNLKLINW